jgi:hypothetical protein
MRFIKFTLLLFLTGCAVNNQKFFKNLETSSDSTYGYTLGNPIKIRNFDFQNSINSSHYYIEHLLSKEKKKLKVISRKAISNPEFKEPLFKNLIWTDSGNPVFNGKGPYIDLYTLLAGNEKDTVKIYVNSYVKSKVKIPVGLYFDK